MSDQNEGLEDIARRYDPSNPNLSFDYWFKRFEANAVIPWLSGNSLLELGGATGELTSLILNDQMNYTIVEGSNSNVLRLRERLPRVDVIESFWETFSTTNLYSDIILFEALEHYSDPVELLKRCSNWLAPGGRIHISVPNGNSLHRQVAVAMDLQSAPDELNSSDRNQGHLRNYTSDLLEDHIKNAGLTVLHSRGLFLKLVPNQMMLNWDPELLFAINAIAENRLEESAELFFVCERM